MLILNALWPKARMRLRVYVVEDSPIMSKLLMDLIGADDAVVAGHADAAVTAIDEIRKLRPDVVIVDIALREGTGLDVLKAIKDEDVAPVRIVLTNYAIRPYREAATRLGATHFFDKADQILDMLTMLRALTRIEKKGNGAPA
jgi:DNA-binding NarL/FixJ family response regulator